MPGQHDRVGDGGDVDDGPREGEPDRFDDARSREGDVHGGTGDATQGVGHLVDCDVGRDEGIHPSDPVALQHAPFLCGSVRENAAHHDARAGSHLLLLEQHADAAVATSGRATELLACPGREQLTVRIIELVHESRRGLREHVLAAQRVHVPGRHDREHLVEESGWILRGSLLQQETASDHGQEQQRGGGRGAGTEHANDLERVDGGSPIGRPCTIYWIGWEARAVSAR
jgi:hypothetical protein